MGGSKQVKPQFLTPPDVGTLRPDLAGLLSYAIRAFGGAPVPGQVQFGSSRSRSPLQSPRGGQGRLGGQGRFGDQGGFGGGEFEPGTNIFSVPLDPLQNAALQQYSGLLTGTAGDQSPAGIAYQNLLQQAETGLPVNLDPAYANLANTFQNTIAPGIRENLGANFGIRFGTPLGEQLSRAGSEATLGLQAQLLPFLEAAQGRRAEATQSLLGIPGQAFAAGTTAQQAQAANLDRFLQTILGGTGALGAQGSFQSPQFKQDNTADYISAIAALIPAIAAAGCWIADALYGSWSFESTSIRIWLVTEFRQRWYGRPVLFLYRAFGRYIAKSRFLCRLLKPLFDAALRKARATQA